MKKRKGIPPSKRPRGLNWEFDTTVAIEGALAARWVHRTGIMVLSSVDIVGGRGPEWHVSVSFRGQVATTEQVQVALAAFDMIGADEDNHVPFGRARNFWKPLNRDVGLCECKDEKLHVAGEYAWRDVPVEP